MLSFLGIRTQQRICHREKQEKKQGQAGGPSGVKV